MIRFVAWTAVVTGLLAPHGPRTESVITRYKVETKTETTIDLSAFGAPSQQQDMTLVSWIAVTLSDTTGGRIVKVTVDSMTYSGTVPVLSQATADSAKHGALRGFLDSNGRIKDLTATPAANVFLADVQGVVNSLFPKVRAGARAGEGWSDTLEVTNTTGGANLKSRFFIDYKAAGEEQVAGLTGLKLTSSSTATITGTMENPQAGTLEVEGTVKGSATSLVTREGRFLSGTADSFTEQLVKTAMAPAPIPIKVVRSVTVTLLP